MLSLNWDFIQQIPSRVCWNCNSAKSSNNNVLMQNAYYPDNSYNQGSLNSLFGSIDNSIVADPYNFGFTAPQNNIAQQYAFNQQVNAFNPFQGLMQMMMMFMQTFMQFMNMANPQQNTGQNILPGMQNTPLLNGGAIAFTGNDANGNTFAGAATFNNTNNTNNNPYAGQTNLNNAPVNGQGLASPTQGRVSSEFGMRNHPISGDRRMHNGIDIAAGAGTRVNSMKQGKVVFAGKQGGYGNLVIIDHGNGLTTRYAHLSSINVRVGDTIAAGQHIGGVGTTGNSTGNHLHFEVRENGKAVNPRNYINV
ncbi:MAG: M23 family metallopeptidase [Cyanobacteriota bacterium]